jgi:hypothetical protein
MAFDTSLSILFERMELNTLEPDQSAAILPGQTLRKIALQIGALERKNQDLSNANRRLFMSLQKFHKQSRP